MSHCSWLTAAKELPLGHRRRLRHDCGEGRDMIVSHNPEGYSAYCFRCGPLGFSGHGYRNLAEIEHINELNAVSKEVQTNELPKDFTPEVPSKHAGWLYRAGISSYRAKSVGIGWSPRSQRVVLPVYSSTGALLYWQARAVLKGQTPKYTNPPVSKAHIIYWAHPKTGPTTKCVVVEDILSAIRVGKHVSTGSILGTKTSDIQAAQLGGYDHVAYWLDPDEAGAKGSISGRRKLSLVTKTSDIRSDADPKNLGDRTLRELLGLEPNHRYEVMTCHK